MKKFLVVPLLLVTVILTGCLGENDMGFGSNAASKCSQKLVVGIDDDFAPMGFRNEKNEIVGFEIDLAKEAGKRLGVDMEFKPIDWNKKKEAITSGEVDMIWNGLDITPERKEYMIFSKPYMDDRQILLVRKDSDLEIYSEYDLEDKIIGTQAGSTSDGYLNNNDELKAGIKEIKTFGKFRDVIESLMNEEIDAIVCDELVARYEMNMNPDRFEIINVKIGDILEMGIGFNKDNVELRDRVQKVFDDMIADGTAKKISEEWFQADIIKSEYMIR